MSDARGKVMTVLGPVEPEALGTTLIHEHILFDLSVYHDQRFGPGKAEPLPDEPLGIQHLLSGRVSARGGPARSLDVRIHGGSQLHFRHPPPALDVELCEKTAADNAAAEGRGRGHPCYYSIHGLPTRERDNYHANPKLFGDRRHGDPAGDDGLGRGCGWQMGGADAHARWPDPRNHLRFQSVGRDAQRHDVGPAGRCRDQGWKGFRQRRLIQGEFDAGGNTIVLLFTGTVSGDQIKFTRKREGAGQSQEFTAKKAS